MVDNLQTAELFLIKKFYNLIKIYLRLVPKGPVDKSSFIFGSDNGLSPNRRQAITWTNDDCDHWCCILSLGHIELILCMTSPHFSWCAYIFAEPQLFISAIFTYLVLMRNVPFINSLWPNDTIWWQGSRSTLFQVMACCLMAPSHYLNQNIDLSSKVPWCSYEGSFTWDITAISH